MAIDQTVPILRLVKKRDARGRDLSVGASCSLLTGGVWNTSLTPLHVNRVNRSNHPGRLR